MEKAKSVLILYDNKFERIYSGLMPFEADPSIVPNKQYDSFGSITKNVDIIAFAKNENFIVASTVNSAAAKGSTILEDYQKFFYIRRDNFDGLWKRLPVPPNVFQGFDGAYTLKVHINNRDCLCIYNLGFTDSVHFYDLAENVQSVFSRKRNRVERVLGVSPIPNTDEWLIVSYGNGVFNIVTYSPKEKKHTSSTQRVPYSLKSILYDEVSPLCLPIIRHNKLFDVFIIKNTTHYTYLYSLFTGTEEVLDHGCTFAFFDEKKCLLLLMYVGSKHGSTQRLNYVKPYIYYLAFDGNTYRINTEITTPNKNIFIAGVLSPELPISLRQAITTSGIYVIPVSNHLVLFYPFPREGGLYNTRYCGLFTLVGNTAKYTNHYTMSLGSHMVYSDPESIRKLIPGTSICCLNNELRYVIPSFGLYKANKHVIVTDGEELF